jgi:hypothetical protein
MNNIDYATIETTYRKEVVDHKAPCAWCQKPTGRNGVMLSPTPRTEVRGHTGVRYHFCNLHSRVAFSETTEGEDIRAAFPQLFQEAGTKV